MKRILCMFMGVFVLIGLSAQKFCITPNGLRNASDTSLPYLIITSESLNSEQLYAKALHLITEKYNNPKEQIKAQMSSKYINYDLYASEFISFNHGETRIVIKAYFSTEMRFRDGEIKYEVLNFTMADIEGSGVIRFSGSGTNASLEFYPSGKQLPEIASERIENYFNERVRELKAYLKQVD